MSDQRKKTKIFVKNISPKDAGRVLRKLQCEKDGEIEVSDASTSAIREIAQGFEDQYIEGQKHAAEEGVRQRREKNAKRNAKIFARYDELSEKRNPHYISSVIAKEFKMDRDTVKRIINKR